MLLRLSVSVLELMRRYLAALLLEAARSALFAAICAFHVSRAGFFFA
jgi:hypothetical protein